MALPISFYGITVADNTKKANGEPETTSMRLPTADIDETNFDAVVSAASAFKTALDAVIIGNMLQDRITAAENSIGTGIAGSTLAQRENKWLFRYHDTVTNQKFQASIGTADLTLLPSGSEFLDLSVNPGLALKTAFQNLVKSPADSTRSVILDSIQFVGRNR